jgi:hypothetical protein
VATLLRRVTPPLLVMACLVSTLSGQAPAPAQTPVPRPEATAFSAAMALLDPAKRLAALDKIRTDFPQAVNMSVVDGQILTVLTNNWPDRIDEITTVFERLIARIAPDATVVTRMNQTVQPVNAVIGKKLLLDRSESLMMAVLEAFTEMKFAELQRETAKRLKQPEPTEQLLKSRFGTQKSFGLEVMARIHAAKGNAARAEAVYREAVDASPVYGSAATALVDIYAGRKEFDKAEDVLKASIKAATMRPR